MLVSARQREGENQHGPVQRDLRLVRDRSRRNQRENSRQTGIGEQHADGTRGEREDQALGEELPYQSPSAGAQRGTDRHLALTRRRLRQQQVRHVRAGDHEQERDRAEQNPDVPGDAAGNVSVNGSTPTRHLSGN